MDLDTGVDDFFAQFNSGDLGVGDFSEPTILEPVIQPLPVVKSNEKRRKNDVTQKKKKDTKGIITNQNKDNIGSKPNGILAQANSTDPRRIDDDGDALEAALPMEERIVNLLVPELKVHDVMLLIKKMEQAGKSDADEFSQLDADQKSAPRFRCETCGNTDQNNFITEYACGDTICNGIDGKGCGTVVQDHIVHEGSAYRKFEGEEDKSHHGPAPNKLFSSGHNLRTLISQDGEMAGNLRRAAEFVEMNLSQMGKDERRTRIGYKDNMKQKACRLIDHTMSNLDLHEIVGSRAKKMFAEFRDLREHVHQFEAMVAGCVIAAYLKTGKEMYNAQNNIRIGGHKQVGQPLPAMLPNKTIDEKILHPFTCPQCGMKFNAKRGMQFHNCMGKNDNEKNDKKRAREELKPIVLTGKAAPIIELRDGKTWYKCPECARVYTKQSDVENHMKRHENQSKKRKVHIENSNVDPTRLQKTTNLASANPSVQVNTHQSVMFRGTGRRPWLTHLQEETNNYNELKAEPKFEEA